MKIAVMNYSGSVGKTIISSYLLYPRMAGAKFFAIETINMSASDLGVSEVMSLTGDNFGKLVEEIVFEDNAIVDIGASNVERFLSTMTKYEGAIDEFDKYLIPVTPDDKAWQESIKTALALSAAGVPKSKIILLPNRIKSTPQEDIASVYEWAKESKKAAIHKDAAVFESEIYEYLAYHKISFEDLLVEDPETFKAKAKTCENAEERAAAARRYRWMKLALPVKRNLDKTFEIITAD
ncbi:TPA: StdB protein [Klebsiella pneumoniae]|nr:StdB protein [Klebsiella pneumoniae]